MTKDKPQIIGFRIASVTVDNDINKLGIAGAITKTGKDYLAIALKHTKKANIMTCKTTKCKHQKDVPHSCHIRCNHPLLPKSSIDDVLTMLGRLPTGRSLLQSHLAKRMGLTSSQTGVDNGWFNWPYNFDPMWLESCNGFEEADK